MAARTSRTRMFVESAELYDAIYHFKNYARECERLRSLIGKAVPAASTILDVACGAGEHARFLKEHYAVDSVDINENYLRAARLKNSAGNYTLADMTDFDLGANLRRRHVPVQRDRQDYDFRTARARDRLYGPSCQTRRSTDRGAMVHTRPVESRQPLRPRR